MNDLTTHALEQALQTYQQFPAVPTSLISYQSNGRVIIVGDDAALSLCREFAAPLKLTLISMQAKAAPGQTDVIALNGRKIELQGYLGNFVMRLSDQQGNTETLRADMVLDLNAKPLLTQQLLPAGYLHEAVTEQNKHELEARLQEMTGEFEKPRYFNYDASICAHGVNGKTVCTNCIDACPAGAISSLIETIEVDAHLCQGGGSCATVCPSGAIQYAYPRLTDSGNRIRKMLQTFHQQGGEQAVVVFHAAPDPALDALAKKCAVLPLRVEEIASVGMDLCLSTLAYGASQVVLLVNSEAPQLSQNQLSQQLEWLQSMLSGLTINPQRISLQYQADQIELIEQKWGYTPAAYSMPQNKRHAIFQALDHLYQQIERTRELVSLPLAAPFGTASIDETRCTLCMACIGACPGKALQDGSNREIPEIFFIESHCIQCGTCTQTCPEQAISISPRIIYNREKRNQSRVLHQDIPFACISCGKAFAPTSIIHKMSHKLKDHYMFKTTRALDRLKMCDDCRVADIVQDPEAIQGSFDPLSNASAKRLS
ncbi:MAG: 4Fe-4S binding protein [Gammaproteobacteria bacterium]|nr:4Fe-4S binding protein [Gammaproteobacteria bacterium]MBL6998653.1 4Fe-4S binding protein [Gammaproteobacteria bacterium]